MTTVEHQLQAMFETGEGLVEGESLYGFILPDGTTMITRVPKTAGIVCRTREWEGMQLIVGPTDAAATLMHEDRVKAFRGRVVEALEERGVFSLAKMVEGMGM